MMETIYGKIENAKQAHNLAAPGSYTQSKNQAIDVRRNEKNRKTRTNQRRIINSKYEIACEILGLSLAELLISNIRADSLSLIRGSASSSTSTNAAIIKYIPICISSVLALGSSFHPIRLPFPIARKSPLKLAFDGRIA